MRKAREGAHTYLLLYFNIRSRVGPERLIFALEGREDIAVYDIWLARELEEEPAEPLDIKGKANVLELSRLIAASETAKNDKVIICIDHDFDAARGYAVPPNTYITSGYSIESLMISAASMDRVLIRCFNATGVEHDSRATLIARFTSLLAQFNEHMLHVNAHARFARLNRIDCPGFPDRIDPIIEVSLSAVTPRADTTDSQVCVNYLGLSASPLPDCLAEHIAHLRHTDLTLTGRGKFLLDFVRRFLTSVFEDRRSASPTYFNAPNRSLPDPCHNLLVNLANAAPTARCFKDFIHLQAGRWQAAGLSKPGIS